MIHASPSGFSGAEFVAPCATYTSFKPAILWSLSQMLSDLFFSNDEK